MSENQPHSVPDAQEFDVPDDDGKIWQYVSADRVVPGDVTRRGVVERIDAGLTPYTIKIVYDNVSGDGDVRDHTSAHKSAPIEVMR